MFADFVDLVVEMLVVKHVRQIEQASRYQLVVNRVDNTHADTIRKLLDLDLGDANAWLFAEALHDAVSDARFVFDGQHADSMMPSAADAARYTFCASALSA